MAYSKKLRTKSVSRNLSTKKKTGRRSTIRGGWKPSSKSSHGSKHSHSSKSSHTPKYKPASSRSHH